MSQIINLELGLFLLILLITVIITIGTCWVSTKVWLSREKRNINSRLYDILHVILIICIVYVVLLLYSLFIQYIIPFTLPIKRDVRILIFVLMMVLLSISAPWIGLWNERYDTYGRDIEKWKVQHKSRKTIWPLWFHPTVILLY